ncbi:hypothetical protein XU18_2898 [Perkinsela sp. CCAP 1560/4]|nr:hypothetical protein XU18_2898 [Perkinsela sp. CCAP 1560/4]|eukprot:KNH06393.1 hypothetical protein XU18_2898 [Perkinsela sp. CCAP 1560/4]
MFVLCQLREKIAIPPNSTGLAAQETPHHQIDPTGTSSEVVDILENLSKTFVGGILPDTGLVVLVNRLIKISHLYIYPGGGKSWCYVDFLATVFRPSIGIILTGVVIHQCEDGIQLTNGFFDDILVSKENLPEQARFSIHKGWSFSGESNNTTEIQRFETMSIRVVHVEFYERTAQTPRLTCSSADQRSYSMRIRGTILPLTV